MSDLLWCRRVRLTLGSNKPPNGALLFGAKEGCNHRIDFRVSKTRSSSKNKGVINIYNLSLDERNLIDEKYDRVILNVGYQGNYPLDATSGFWSDIVNGWVYKVTHEQRGVDMVTDIEYIEAKVEHNNASFNKTFDGGTSFRSIVKKIVETSMPAISIGDISGIKPESLVTKGRGRTYSGQAMEIISEIALNNNSRATIDDDVLHIISNDGGLEVKGGIPLFAAETGLIGSPAKTEKGVNFSALIHPHIRPNQFIAVRDDLIDSGVTRNSVLSEAQRKALDKKNKDEADKNNSPVASRVSDNYIRGLGGVYRVNKVDFIGSNRGSKFVCNIEGQYSDGFKVKRELITYSPVAKDIPTQEIENE